MSEHRHPIGVVCRRTGLKPDLIRAWERRYGAIEPSRSETRRRLYSDQDIERLKLLRQAVAGGRGIRHVANLAADELVELIAADRAERGPGLELSLPPSPAGGAGPPQELVQACLEAVHQLDGGALEAVLERASVSLSRVDLLERLLVPLLHRIGDLWEEGTLRPSHEHLASAVVRTFLGQLTARPGVLGAPHLLVTTPAGQVHELGALMAAECALDQGWQVTYLGPNLPAEEIAAGCHQRGARAVALSITYPPDDPHLGPELERLRRLLPATTLLWVGGRSAPTYQAFLDSVGARRLDTLGALRAELEASRRR